MTKAKDKNSRKLSAIKSKERLRRNRIIAILSVAIIAALLYFLSVYVSGFEERKIIKSNIELFELKAKLLEEEMFLDERLNNLTQQPGMSAFDETGYVVFFSVSDIDSRAKVITATGNTIENAWDSGVNKTREYLNKSKLEPLWVKVDFVDTMDTIKISELRGIMEPFRSYFFRKGLAFDDSFNIAFLEAELNGNNLIDYENYELDMEGISQYLEAYSSQTIDGIPDELIVFTTIGWFCDEENAIFSLYGYESNGYNYGRRIIENLDKDILEEIIVTSSEWLIEEVQENGAFIYGYYPIFDEQLTHYNILRHIVSVQPLIWYYEMTGREDLVPVIERTINYLVQDNIEYSNRDVAYVIDRPNDEIKLGGNGVAIILLKEYMDTFNTDKYEELCVHLGNGILDIMDVERGTFFHVLNTDFTKKDEYRTVYYDGEATYALAIVYGITGEQKWLDAAQASVENFIREDYTKHRDHWVAYAMKEVTRYVDDSRYYEFALRNVQENLDDIYFRDTSYHTYLELLMASYELYHRMIEDEIKVDYMDEFDANYFFETILKRAEHMLNGYLYPEYSMYLSKPGKYLGTFVIRHDAYRVRIDDVEHFIAGYYNLWRNYGQIIEYRESHAELTLY